MSATAIMATSPAPHERSSYADMAHSSPSVHLKSGKSLRSIAPPPSANQNASRPDSKSPKSHSKPNTTKTSPLLSRNVASSQIAVKKEPPSSPDLRHRPRKLDLTGNSPRANANQSNDATNSFPPGTSRTMNGQFTGRMENLGIQEVGLACLSPGFNTQDPTMRDQLQRSISVREQQRTLIEARMNKQFAKQDNTSATENLREQETSGALTSKTPGNAKRKAPPGLSILTPSHEEFAQERVIQSAPLNQSFTMGRYQPQPPTRQITNHQTQSSIQHVPAIQSSNRLPPIMDVFAREHLSHHDSSKQRSSALHPTNSQPSNSLANQRPPFPPASQPNAQPSHSSRPREYRSAEDAQVDLSGGRPELLPRLVHYGGHQPPTPPSPRNMKTPRQSDTSRSGGGGGVKKRVRSEYEDGDTPPYGNGSLPSRRNGPLQEERTSPISSQMKKEQFIRLCAEAWDLFHSWESQFNEDHWLCLTSTQFYFLERCIYRPQLSLLILTVWFRVILLVWHIFLRSFIQSANFFHLQSIRRSNERGYVFSHWLQPEISWIIHSMRYVNWFYTNLLCATLKELHAGYKVIKKRTRICIDGWLLHNFVLYRRT